jgi:formylglycine-generating enzyme required for sulfatase activity
VLGGVEKGRQREQSNSGGSWSYVQVLARATYRLNGAPDYRSYDLGLRVVRSSPSLP